MVCSMVVMACFYCHVYSLSGWLVMHSLLNQWSFHVYVLSGNYQIQWCGRDWSYVRTVTNALFIWGTFSPVFRLSVRIALWVDGDSHDWWQKGAQVCPLHWHFRSGQALSLTYLMANFTTDWGTILIGNIILYRTINFWITLRLGSLGNVSQNSVNLLFIYFILNMFHPVPSPKSNSFINIFCSIRTPTGEYF